jgi:hypothetical protein
MHQPIFHQLYSPLLAPKFLNSVIRKMDLSTASFKIHMAVIFIRKLSSATLIKPKQLLDRASDENPLQILPRLDGRQ